MASTTPMSNDSSTSQNTAPPRKRRRRTAGGGAQDDCFTCRKRGQPCDRKRPYCSQCIDIGKECTGYKTTLTWGVGVASRGKLRGLSLPVASKSATEQSSAKVVPDTKRRKSSVSKPSVPPSKDTTSSQSQMSASIPISHPQARNLQNPTSAPSGISWQDQISNYPPSSSSFEPLGMPRNPSLRHIQTAFTSHLDALPFPSSASSTGSFADIDFHTPIEYTPTSASLPFADHLAHQNDPYLNNIMGSSSALGSDNDSLGPQASSLAMLQDYGTDAGNLNTNYDMALLGQLSDVDENDYANDEMIPSLDIRFGNHLFHMPQRLQTLIHYYDVSICPFLVAFDSPSNPYRMHIIQLASHNEALQHALAALATNNMRMRRRQPRSIGYVEELEEATAEETRHKQLSIEQLNVQLTQPSAPQDDSVLATLLVLCLFHVCDSGFSKFKVQLAGVQKLMSLRDPSTKSPFTGWVEMFFIWFDVMTAAVNDREPQIKGESLDMMDYSVNLGALEQYSGCDGRLFKLIARLGGLSLLAQGRVPSQTPSQRPHRNRFKAPAHRSLDVADYELIDGNGWGTPIYEVEEEDVMSPSAQQSQFWTEWHDIRSRLQAWNVDASTFAPQSSNPTMTFDASNLTAEQKDLVHISESFRHSALLYTERLANPLLPSLAPVFQQHVAQVLFHITALPVTSCVNKFLLWPLFITGTECVDGGDRAVIRTRCVEIQRESGFYNNISCLDLLEKVWHEIDVSNTVGGEVNARRRDSETRQAFRWRRAMDRVDGEYLII